MSDQLLDRVFSDPMMAPRHRIFAIACVWLNRAHGVGEWTEEQLSEAVGYSRSSIRRIRCEMIKCGYLAYKGRARGITAKNGRCKGHWEPLVLEAPS